MQTQAHLYQKAGNRQISCMQPATVGYATIWDPRSSPETRTEAAPLDASRGSGQALRHSNQTRDLCCALACQRSLLAWLGQETSNPDQEMEDW